MPKDLFAEAANRDEIKRELIRRELAKREAEAQGGPWTGYQQQALDELNRRRGERGEGPWTRYQPRDLFSPEQQKALALANARKRAASQGGGNIEVELPDGSVALFPAGTPDATIKGAIQKHLSRGAPQAAEPMLTPEYDALGNPTGRSFPVEPSPLSSNNYGALQHDDALSQIRTASGGFLEGSPVVGPLIRGGVDRAAAGTLALFSDQSYDDI